MTPTDRRRAGNQALRDYAEGAFCGVLVALILTAYVLGGPVTGTVTAVLVGLFVSGILLARIGDRGSVSPKRPN